MLEIRLDRQDVVKVKIVERRDVKGEGGLVEFNYRRSVEYEETICGY